MFPIKHLWGKAKKIKTKDSQKLIYHPLICHLIDVAAVAETMWDEIFSKSIKEQLSHYFFKDNISFTKQWLIFLAAFHDLGKATPLFQSKVPELAKNLSQFGLELFEINKFHSILSGEIYNRFLLEHKIEDPILNFKFVIGGHHGVFPKVSQFDEIIPEYLGNKNWIDIQDQLILAITVFCGLDLNLQLQSFKSERILDNPEMNALLVFITGFISIADWIGSNDDFFDYYLEFDNFEELVNKYFPISRERAKKALDKIHWANWKSQNNKNPILSFIEVFSKAKIKSLRPLQTTVVNNISDLTTPCLIIIEAPMGEGKTEAALYIEYFLERTKEMQGAFIALPTQATANQMFHRVKDFLSTTKKGLKVNLHLLHGNALLSNEYLLLRTKSKNFEEESNIIADEWFTYRKRGLISPFGVGTVDQILLSVLHLKYFFIRLFGLAGKVIIIDEVHSYDMYMSTILEYLLFWLQLLGSTVILLSATLPAFKRKKLINAFYKKNEDIPTTSYPRITFCSKDRVKVINFEASLKKQGDGSVVIDWIDDNSIEDKLKLLLKDKGRAAIVCNEVKRAQDLYLRLKHLKECGIEVELLHSRFPYIRRNEIEKSVLEKFGKNQDHTEFRRLIISTQIIEQSLDLDFDLMMSDLAPIDLMFQRMGRLHRHVRDNDDNLVIRPESLKRPQFFVIKPPLKEHGIPSFNRPIYSKYILLKTYMHFWGATTISIPDDLEPYIERVYNDDDTIPAIFNNTKEHWKNELDAAKKSKDNLEEERVLSAKYKLISNPSDEDFFENFSIYFDENTPQAEESLQNLTRITMISVNLVCLYEDNGNFYLDKGKTIPMSLSRQLKEEEAIKLLDFTVKVSNYPLFKHFIEKPNTIPAQWRRNRLVRNIHYVVLKQEKEGNKFFFETTQNKVYVSKSLGLYIQQKRNES